MRCTGAPQTGQGLPKRPCTAMPSRNAVTFSGKPPFASSRILEVHSVSTDFVAWKRRRVSSSVSLEVMAIGESFARCRIFVGVRVADAGEQVRIRQRALEGVVLRF